jgi:hypothetical protein
VGVTVSIFGVAVTDTVICVASGITNFVSVGAAEIFGDSEHAARKTVMIERITFFIFSPFI